MTTKSVIAQKLLDLYEERKYCGMSHVKNTGTETRKMQHIKK